MVGLFAMKREVFERIVIAVALLASVLSAGCSPENQVGAEQMAVLDDRQRDILLPLPVTRIVSLGPSFTEIIFAIGAEEKLVGVTTYCDYPEAALQKPKVGDFLNPSVERIVALEPDCVLATGPTQTRIVERLEKLGLKVVQLNPESIAGVERCIEVIGGIAGIEAVAAELIEGVRDSVAQMNRLTSQIQKRRRVFLEIDANPLVSASPGSFLGELVRLAGGENVVGSGSGYPVVNPEQVIEWDPEVIIIASPAVSLEQVRGRVGWEQVSAVKQGRICRVDPSLISRPGPRGVQGAAELHRLIYPEPAVGGGDQ
jgi:iron complex transport system substrate-binding protein